MELSQRSKTNIDFESLFSHNTLTISSFPKYGSNPELINNMLRNDVLNDVSYKSGRVLGAMSTQPHFFAAKLYSEYMEKNLGDRGLNPGTAKIEAKLVQMMGSLLGASHTDTIKGNMTSGGTESNIIAIYLARSLQPEISHPNIVLSEAAHYSFEKIARLMNIELRFAHLKDDFHPDMHEYQSLINDSTIALVGIAGTSALGLVDPTDKIAELARKYHKFLHIDGAFGGFVLPFLEKLGHQFPIYDFRSPYVNTISVDPHKMGMNVNPSGIFLVKDGDDDNSKVKKENGFKIPYLAGGGFRTFNILGTRPGAPAISFWGLIHFLGFEGFLEIVQQAWDLTKYLEDQIQKIPQLSTVCSPETNVLGIQFSNGNNIRSSKKIKKLNQILREHDWYLGFFENRGLLRFVSMPHVNHAHIDEFLNDLKRILYYHF
ncbi:tyrosine decarboxylase MfnA [Candidatus Harpocratesius sp.]